ncbi:MAG: LLM class flavin-dependent oxidoreductase [Chloroflexota bacterium]|nr:LLM class flavin-dependent oxidoreductase [Chloroflexota bacterium]
MKYGVIITGGLVREQVELARTAEAAGWDGVFTWDGIHVGDQVEVHDPWVLMGAFAMATERVRIGAIIQPLSRRRPWKVARESVTLDHVSNGRFVLCVGLGAVDDSGWGRVGEETDRRIRAERLDETLQILVGLWTGDHSGFRASITASGQWPSSPRRSSSHASRSGSSVPGRPRVRWDGRPATTGSCRTSWAVPSPRLG